MTSESDPQRREVLHSIACLSGAALSLPHAAMATTGSTSARRYKPSLLVGDLGDPILASSIPVGEPWVFSYPFKGTPAFLIRLPQPVAPTPKDRKGPGLSVAFWGWSLKHAGGVFRNLRPQNDVPDAGHQLYRL